MARARASGSNNVLRLSKCIYACTHTNTWLLTEALPGVRRPQQGSTVPCIIHKQFKTCQVGSFWFEPLVCRGLEMEREDHRHMKTSRRSIPAMASHGILLCASFPDESSLLGLIGSYTMKLHTHEHASSKTMPVLSTRLVHIELGMVHVDAREGVTPLACFLAQMPKDSASGGIRRT